MGPYDCSSGFTIENGYQDVLSIYQADPRVSESSGTYPVSGSIPVEYQGDPYYTGNPYFIWKFIEAADYAGYSMIDWEPYVVVDQTSLEYRENDPFFTNDLNALRPIREMCVALERVAQRAETNVAHIGLYDLVPLIYRRINNIRNTTSGSFNVWAKNQEKIALTKVYNGLSIVDIINSFQGKFFYTMYVPTATYDSSTAQRNVFRRYNKRVMSFLDGLGMDAVPLFHPNLVDNSAVQVSSTLLQGLRDDAEAYQPGEWGIWASSTSITQGAFTTFVNIMNA